MAWNVHNPMSLASFRSGTWGGHTLTQLMPPLLDTRLDSPFGIWVFGQSFMHKVFQLIFVKNVQFASHCAHQGKR